MGASLADNPTKVLTPTYLTSHCLGANNRHRNAWGSTTNGCNSGCTIAPDRATQELTISAEFATTAVDSFSTQSIVCVKFEI